MNIFLDNIFRAEVEDHTQHPALIPLVTAIFLCENSNYIRNKYNILHIHILMKYNDIEYRPSVWRK